MTPQSTPWQRLRLSIAFSGFPKFALNKGFSEELGKFVGFCRTKNNLLQRVQASVFFCEPDRIICTISRTR
jgi:hypothetical protein